MKTIKDLSSNPTIIDLMEVAHDEGKDGYLVISDELCTLMQHHHDNAEAWGRVFTARKNGFAEYLAHCDTEEDD